MKRTITTHPVCSQLHGKGFWRLDLFDHRTVTPSTALRLARIAGARTM